MIPLPTGVRMWLTTGYTDMRKSFPSLALQVQEGRPLRAADAAGREPGRVWPINELPSWTARRDSESRTRLPAKPRCECVRRSQQPNLATVAGPAERRAFVRLPTLLEGGPPNARGASALGHNGIGIRAMT